MLPMIRLRTASLGAVAMFYGFAPTALAAQYTELFQFTGGATGGTPTGNLVYKNGSLYGVGTYGGQGWGVVFDYNIASSQVSAIYTLNNPGPSGVWPDNIALFRDSLIGEASLGGGKVGSGHNGAVFRFDLGTGKARGLHLFGMLPDGTSPNNVVAVGSVLYGTTQQGGTYDGGVAFRLDPATGAETILHQFQGGADAGNPTIGLVLINGALYGASDVGGAYNRGTIFRLDPAAGQVTVIYSFNGNGGASPRGLISAGGKLYGVASDFGAWGWGSLFSYDTVTGKMTTLHMFSDGLDGNNDGGAPDGAVALYKGKVYGTTASGPQASQSAGFGTVFEYDLATKQYVTIHAFQGYSDGGGSTGGMIEAHGVLYGTTAGAIGPGTLFEVQPDAAQ